MLTNHPLPICIKVSCFGCKDCIQRALAMHGSTSTREHLPLQVPASPFSFAVFFQVSSCPSSSRTFATCCFLLLSLLLLLLLLLTLQQTCVSKSWWSCSRAGKCRLCQQLERKLETVGESRTLPEQGALTHLQHHQGGVPVWC